MPNDAIRFLVFVNLGILPFAYSHPIRLITLMRAEDKRTFRRKPAHGVSSYELPELFLVFNYIWVEDISSRQQRSRRPPHERHELPICAWQFGAIETG